MCHCIHQPVRSLLLVLQVFKLLDRQKHILPHVRAYGTLAKRHDEVTGRLLVAKCSNVMQSVGRHE